MTSSDPAHGPAMTADEVGMLLGRISAFDGRNVGAAEITAWQLIAARGRWTLAEATEQVIEWFTEPHRNHVGPGDINALIRADRQQRALKREPTMAFTGEGVGEITRQEIMRRWAAERAESKERSKARKAMVGKFPDLVAKFDAIGIGTFENWEGWIAPATVPSPSPDATSTTTEVGTGFKVNTSRTRKAVVEIVDEAQSREETQA